MIRLLTADDTQAYKHLRLQALQTDPLSYISSYEQESTQEDYFFRHQLTYTYFPPAFGYFGIFEDDELVGYLNAEKNYGKQAHTATLFNLYIDPKQRGKGLAKQLIDFVLTELKKRGIEVVYMSAAHDNQKAINLYKKMGFQEYGVRPKYLKSKDGHFQNEVLLYREL